MNENDANNTYEECYVAFLDILGFKEIIYSNPHNYLHELYERFEKYVVSDTLTAINEIGQGANKIECFVISDSVFLWTTDSSNDSFFRIITMVTRILLSGFMAEIPFRGGIAKGPLTVKKSKFGSTLYGLALTKAYMLETLQTWSGCIIEKGLVENFLLEPYYSQAISQTRVIDKYNVILKNGKTEDYWCLNWPVRVVRNEDEITKMFENHGKKSDREDVLVKISNSITFYRDMSAKHADYKNEMVRVFSL